MSGTEPQLIKVSLNGMVTHEGWVINVNSHCIPLIS